MRRTVSLSYLKTRAELAPAPTPAGLTRSAAFKIVTDREGTAREHLAICTDMQLIAAARAGEGQPCGDCGKLVVYRADDWYHLDPEAACFLADPLPEDLREPEDAEKLRRWSGDAL